MIGKFELAMVEPKAWEQAYGSLVDKVGWGKGVPVAEFVQYDARDTWKIINDIIDELEASGRSDRALRFQYLLVENRDHFFFKTQVKAWDYQASYLAKFKKCEVCDVLVSSRTVLDKEEAVIGADDLSGHEYFDGKKIKDVSRRPNTKEIVSVVEPIVQAESHFKIVDYLFGHVNDFFKNRINEQWRSIFDIISKINEIKRLSNKNEALDASIEIHSVFDPHHPKEFYGEIIKQELPLNCPVKVYSWKHSKFEGNKNEYDEDFDTTQENPHERMFLTNSIGLKVEHGLDYARGSTEATMFDLDIINRNNDKYTRGLDDSYQFHWVLDLEKLGYSKS